MGTSLRFMSEILPVIFCKYMRFMTKHLLMTPMETLCLEESNRNEVQQR